MVLSCKLRKGLLVTCGNGESGQSLENTTVETLSLANIKIQEFQTMEAIKTLRTNVVFGGGDTKVIGLTSCDTGDGTSSIALQLAISMAQSGKKTILVDADLRKSVLQNRVKHRGNMTGLSHYLSGMSELTEIECETDVSSFAMILAGDRVSNPAELLGSVGFADMIRQLRAKYDYVIVDTPPLGRVIDCAIISPALDGIAIVVNAENNSYKLVRRIKAQIERANGRIIGIVLNKVNLREKHGYYRNTYGKYYGKYD